LLSSRQAYTHARTHTHTHGLRGQQPGSNLIP